MTTCCPNCASPAAMGTDIASMCTECASVSIAGASLSVPTMLACAAFAVGVGLVVNLVRRSRAARVSCA
ncbi:MAG: hypothetical protein CBC35_02705 [Planctomycetes bacterium TMED75]|nr:hypothetical protein [Planctomycetaceae bacterium]OUU95305.1 MAG: hypothetical protein CBC35_02705 [Planctomycetes bacterium TMED75]